MSFSEAYRHEFPGLSAVKWIFLVKVWCMCIHGFISVLKVDGQVTVFTLKKDEHIECCVLMDSAEA